MKRPLRFAMLTTFYPPHNFGGDGQYVRRLSYALARRGHEVEVIYDADAYRVLGGAATQADGNEPSGIKVHAMHSAIPMLSCLATHQTGYPLVHGANIRAILSRGFDVIHFHNVSLVGGPGVFTYGQGVKLYTAHEHWLVCPTHILWRHNREPCTGRECIRCALAHRRPPQLWRRTELLARQSRHIDAFIALSQFSADKHAEFGFTPPMTVLPPFLPEATAELDPPKASGRPYFLFVGRLEAIKGLQDVIPIFGSDSLADLLVAGSGNYEKELRALAAGSPFVRFLGQQSAASLQRLYDGARALITPSICFEVFPLVVLEAFRQGLPIIARRLGPYPEIIAASGAGMLFSDQNELKAAISAFMIDNGQRQAMAEAAKRAFQERWREDVVLEDYFNLIYLIAKKRSLGTVLSAFEGS
jgi:glycosyltransferase involved in cell wall biosynthesis